MEMGIRKSQLFLCLIKIVIVTPLSEMKDEALISQQRGNVIKEYKYGSVTTVLPV